MKHVHRWDRERIDGIVADFWHDIFCRLEEETECLGIDTDDAGRIASQAVKVVRRMMESACAVDRD